MHICTSFFPNNPRLSIPNPNTPGSKYIYICPLNPSRSIPYIELSVGHRIELTTDSLGDLSGLLNCRWKQRLDVLKKRRSPLRRPSTRSPELCEEPNALNCCVIWLVTSPTIFLKMRRQGGSHWQEDSEKLAQSETFSPLTLG